MAGILLNYIFHQRQQVCAHVYTCVHDMWMLFSQVGCVVCVRWMHELGTKNAEHALRTICLYVSLVSSQKEINGSFPR